MKKANAVAVAVSCCALAWCADRMSVAAVHAQTNSAPLYDWVTDGGDNYRTGWNKQEKILTKDNVKTVIDDGAVPADQVCVSALSDACGQLGIQ